MKKLSLILAFVLVFACVLVACNDEAETSSTPEAESSAAATESSEAAKEESSEAATESSEAATESSEAVEESSEAEVSTPEAGTENLAAGKTYTNSALFRQGSEGYDPNAPISYPDEDGKAFVDGILPPSDATFTSPEWVGFNGHDPEYEGYHWISLDLGEKKDLAKYVFKYGTSALTAGITPPATIEIFVSDDGENWGDAIGGDMLEDDYTNVNGVYELYAAASGRYVQFRFTSSSWAFISEIEVYGAAE
ncbi:MAG: discoidin domain-containing protein [Clostridia bacterium]|nr:discoidin domain-containing protein [Clostridia bacterium]